MAKRGTRKTILRLLARQLQSKKQSPREPDYQSMTIIGFNMLGLEQRIADQEKRLKQSKKRLKKYQSLQHRTRKLYHGRKVVDRIRHYENKAGLIKDELAELRKVHSSWNYAEKRLVEMKQILQAIMMPEKTLYFIEKKTFYNRFAAMFKELNAMQGNPGFDQNVAKQIPDMVSFYLPLNLGAVETRKIATEMEQAAELSDDFQRAQQDLQEIDKEKLTTPAYFAKRYQAYKTYMTAYEALEEATQDNAWAKNLVDTIDLLDNKEYQQISARYYQLETSQNYAEDLQSKLDELHYSWTSNKKYLALNAYLYRKAPRVYDQFQQFMHNNLNKLARMDPQKTFLENQDQPHKLKAMAVKIDQLDYKLQLGLETFERAQKNITALDNVANFGRQLFYDTRFKETAEELMLNSLISNTMIEDVLEQADSDLDAVNAELDDIEKQKTINQAHAVMFDWLQNRSQPYLDRLQAIIDKETQLIKTESHGRADNYQIERLKKYAGYIEQLKQVKPATIEEANKWRKAIHLQGCQLARAVMGNDLARLEYIAERQQSEPQFEQEGKYAAHLILMGITEYGRPELNADRAWLMKHIAKNDQEQVDYLQNLLQTVHEGMSPDKTKGLTEQSLVDSQEVDKRQPAYSPLPERVTNNQYGFFNAQKSNDKFEIDQALQHPNRNRHKPGR